MLTFTLYHQQQKFMMTIILQQKSNEYKLYHEY